MLISFAALLISLFETERVNSVWTAEKVSFRGIALDVFPSGMGPSAWHELKILLWVTICFLILLFYEILGVQRACLYRSVSVTDVFASAEISRVTSLSLILHCL
jgi:hypothetical protein